MPAITIRHLPADDNTNDQSPILDFVLHVKFAWEIRKATPKRDLKIKYCYSRCQILHNPLVLTA